MGIMIIDGTKQWELRRTQVNCKKWGCDRIGIAASGAEVVLGSVCFSDLKEYSIEEFNEHSREDKHRVTRAQLRKYAKDRGRMFAYMFTNPRRYCRPYRHTPISGPLWRLLRDSPTSGPDLIWHESL